MPALAKLTLSLRVTGRTATGLHTLEAEMVNIDLADSLFIGEGDGLATEDGGAGPAGFGFSAVPSGSDNLVLRALAACRRQAHVRLVKRVPAGAGLGGGSADAAAVLRWAGCTGPEGLALAAGLGSDVPFCLAGGGRARVSGVGEVLQPLPFAEVAGQAYTLVVPPFGVPTGAVYAAWDALGGPTGLGPNDLEPPALEVEPRLRQWRQALGDSTGQEPVLAGSGSTWYVKGGYPGPGRTVVRVTRP